MPRKWDTVHIPGYVDSEGLATLSKLKSLEAHTEENEEGATDGTITCVPVMLVHFFPKRAGIFPPGIC